MKIKNIETFSKLYATKTNKEVAKIYNIGPNTVIVYAQQLGLPMKGKGFLHIDDKRKKTFIKKYFVTDDID